MFKITCSGINHDVGLVHQIYYYLLAMKIFSPRLIQYEYFSQSMNKEENFSQSANRAGQLQPINE